MFYPSVLVFVNLAAWISTVDCEILEQINLTQGKSVKWPPPPPWTEKAKMARFLAHFADWGVVSSISQEFDSIPFGTVQSFSDGPMHNSTGTPYFYMASISDTWKNINHNNSASLTLSHAESNYCSKLNLDPEEPLCARLTLAGKIIPVTNDERSFAKEALFTRHPAMKLWPTDHGWDFYKLVPSVVYLLDFYGGATHVPVQEYYSTEP